MAKKGGKGKYIIDLRDDGKIYDDLIRVATMIMLTETKLASLMKKLGYDPDEIVETARKGLRDGYGEDEEGDRSE